MKLTVLNPALKFFEGEVVVQTFGHRVISRGICLTDYIAVSHVDVHGTWEMADCMGAESRARLARWANEEERKERNERGRRRHGR